MDGLAWWASLLSTAGIRLNTAYLHTTRIEFIQGAGKSLFLAYSGRIMSFWFFFFPSLFGFFPTLRIFQPQKFICKLINDLHLTARYEKMRAYCPTLQIGLRSNSFSYERSERVLGALKVVDRWKLMQTSSVVERCRGSGYAQTQASFLAFTPCTTFSACASRSRASYSPFILGWLPTFAYSTAISRL